MQETLVQSLGWEDPLERGGTWQPTPVFSLGESPWTEEPGGLQSTESQRVEYNWATEHSTANQSMKMRKACPCSQRVQTVNIDQKGGVHWGSLMHHTGLRFYANLWGRWLSSMLFYFFNNSLYFYTKQYKMRQFLKGWLRARKSILSVKVSVSC